MRSAKAVVGETIGGYRLVRLIGSGSTGSVFLGEHVRVGHRAAVKVLARELVADELVVRRMLAEARLVNDLRHPNLVDITDFIEGVDPRWVALVMEYIEGPSLRTLRGVPLEPAVALPLVVELLDAVGAAHDQGVLHRGLKPANLLLTFDPLKRSDEIPTVKVADFGIVCPPSAGRVGTMDAGARTGMPVYGAPEQIAGSPPPSPATDVFALGEVLYEMLSGEHVYPGAGAEEIVRGKLRGVWPPLRVPVELPGLLEVIEACLAPRPSDRPSLEALRAGVERARRCAGPEVVVSVVAGRARRICLPDDPALTETSTQESELEASRAPTMALDAFGPSEAPSTAGGGVGAARAREKGVPSWDLAGNLGAAPGFSQAAELFAGEARSWAHTGVEKPARRAGDGHDETVELPPDDVVGEGEVLSAVSRALGWTRPEVDAVQSGPSEQGHGGAASRDGCAGVAGSVRDQGHAPVGLPAGVDVTTAVDIEGQPSATSSFLVGVLVFLSILSVVAAVAGFVVE